MRLIVSRLVVFIFCSLTLAATPAESQAPQEFEIIIKGGRILDGSGNPWFISDIGVKAGRVAAIGNLSNAPAARTVDATGKFVTPGFIDLHSHSDRGLETPELRYNLNMVAQGITLSVLNQDGRSPRWPLKWQRDEYEKRGIGNNVALMIGHGTIRVQVMQKRSNQTASEADIQAMQKLVEEGMKDGGFGLSTGLEYVPGRF